MCFARAKQDANVARTNGAAQAGVSVAHRLSARQQPRNFLGDGLRLRLVGYRTYQPQRIALAWLVRHRKHVVVVVAKCVTPRGSFFDGGKQIVGKCEQLTHGSKAARDRRPHLSNRPQRLDETRCFVEDSHLCVAKSIDRLLAVADDEDRRRSLAPNQAKPLGPRPDQQLDQLPLGAAGVLELVDEYMVITRLEL